jgi:hypothetical protein
VCVCVCACVRACACVCVCVCMLEGRKRESRANESVEECKQAQCARLSCVTPIFLYVIVYFFVPS